ncbi:MAG: hypothetical protein ACE5FO_00665 [Parvularculaceae bacterium]
MKIKMLAGFALIASSAAEVEAAAYCREPQPPRAPYAKPSPPSCLSQSRYGREAECDQWELDNYARAVEAYERKLQDYVDEARRYYDEALAYARCESENAREGLN